MLVVVAGQSRLGSTKIRKILNKPLTPYYDLGLYVT